MLPSDLLKWIEKNPIQVVALAIALAISVFSVTSCVGRVMEAEYKWKIERDRSFYERSR